VEIPATLETTIDTAVTRHLQSELGARGLLLNSAELGLAESTNAALGRWLMERLLRECYPDAEGLAVQFERTDDMARIGAALAFGAVTSRVLAGAHDRAGRRSSVEYVCGVFNLAIGLVDGICDGDTTIGAQLLDHCHDADLIGAAIERPQRGWLHTRLPNLLAADDAVAFVATVIEAFFAGLHDLYVDDPQVRRIVGQQLADALEAETDSVRDPFTALSAAGRVRCSRATSVLPFEIISTITTAELAPAVSSRATMLGEAMWRVDDLVDRVLRTARATRSLRHRRPGCGARLPRHRGGGHRGRDASAPRTADGGSHRRRPARLPCVRAALRRNRSRAMTVRVRPFPRWS